MRRRALLPALMLAIAVAGCGSDSTTGPSGPSSLVIEDLIIGTGAAAASGDIITVHYVGALPNGTRIDSSYDRGQPFTFRLGAGTVIAGWDQGLVGMRVGGKRRLTIPPALGYGSRAVGSIPPNSTLIFEVDLISIAGR